MKLERKVNKLVFWLTLIISSVFIALMAIVNYFLVVWLASFNFWLIPIIAALIFGISKYKRIRVESRMIYLDGEPTDMSVEDLQEKGFFNDGKTNSDEEETE